MRSMYLLNKEYREKCKHNKDSIIKIKKIS